MRNILSQRSFLDARRRELWRIPLVHALPDQRESRREVERQLERERESKLENGVFWGFSWDWSGIFQSTASGRQEVQLLPQRDVSNSLWALSPCRLGNEQLRPPKATTMACLTERCEVTPVLQRFELCGNGESKINAPPPKKKKSLTYSTLPSGPGMWQRD